MASARNEVPLDEKGNVDLTSEKAVKRLFKRLFEVGHLIAPRREGETGEAARDRAIKELSALLIGHVGWAEWRVIQLRNQAAGWASNSGVFDLSRLPRKRYKTPKNYRP